MLAVQLVTLTWPLAIALGVALALAFVGANYLVHRIYADHHDQQPPDDGSGWGL